jgi:ADP-ribose pyrophosphatase YjhB (NUDIX family)
MNKMRYVVGYLFDNQGDYVALIRKHNCTPEQKWQEGCYNGLGGKIQMVATTDHPEKTWPTSHHEETPHQAMRREFKEEAGVDIPEDNWELFLTVEKTSRNDGNPIELYMFKCFSTERLQQVETASSEGEVIVTKISEILSNSEQIIDPARILLALERDRKFEMKELN